ncbi:8322_t:CDS:1, partial [Paraglomus occultum]
MTETKAKAPITNVIAYLMTEFSSCCASLLIVFYTDKCVELLRVVWRILIYSSVTGRDPIEKLAQYIKENEDNLEPEEINTLAYNLAKTAPTVIAQSS